MEIDATIREQVKTNRLRSIEVQYFEFQMNKVAFEANGLIQQAAEAQKNMDEAENAYNAILKL